MIPNYNRPKALSRLLKSIFAAIKHADADEAVRVLVVDDYSTEDIAWVIEPYLKKPNFLFRMQKEKCGNAELSFLSAVGSVGTEYTWLLGNDDIVSQDSIAHILKVIEGGKYGFILLNPQILKVTQNRDFLALNSTSESVVYDRTEDLFYDFGFVTSTTTFPCLVFKTDPVVAFHEEHRLTAIATVYSHTFTFFAALRDQPALFLSLPIVGFTLNERLEEQVKLQKQAPAGVQFYHQSLGLARLIQACADKTRVPVAAFGASLEDEVDKDSLRVHGTLLSHFLLFFFIEQTIRECDHSIRNVIGFRYLLKTDVAEIRQVVHRFDDHIVSHYFESAVDVFNSMAVSSAWKIEYLRNLQRSVLGAAHEKYEKLGLQASHKGAHKIHEATFGVYPLRGRRGDAFGGEAAPI
ncbi:hypothetical protein AS593_03660 [Caulobacter vibrioides]|nr:hypothetical protein AS593_03660 [Caulobacter vibrioides]